MNIPFRGVAKKYPRGHQDYFDGAAKMKGGTIWHQPFVPF